MTHRKTAVIVGALFLIAMVVSIAGGVLIDQIISGDGWQAKLGQGASTIKLGVALELLNGLCVIGIGALLFPVLKPHGEGAAMAYVGLRLTEAICYMLPVSGPLMLLRLAGPGVALDASQLATVHAQVIAERMVAMNLFTPLFLGLGCLVLYALLYQSRLVPRYLAVWGFVGAILMMLLNLIGISAPVGMLMVIPLILNEIYLGIYLIAKGFSDPT